MSSSLLASIQVGMPQHIGTSDAAEPMDREWFSGFFKYPVTAPAWLSLTRLEGDGQADLKHHGGPEKAVLAYARSHYSVWQNELNLSDRLPFGAFGENFTIADLSEDSVCIGDTFSIGEAIIQVSQPRVPCWKIARRLRIDGIEVRVKETGRTGWYSRVLKEGYVQPGLRLTLLDRPCPEWTVAKANDVIHQRNKNAYDITNLARCELLAPEWKNILTARLKESDRG